MGVLLYNSVSISGYVSKPVATPQFPKLTMLDYTTFIVYISVGITLVPNLPLLIQL